MQFYYLSTKGTDRFRYACKDLTFVRLEGPVCSCCGRNINHPVYAQDIHHFLLDGGKRYPDWLDFCGVGGRLILLSQSAVEAFQKEGITGLADRGPVKVSRMFRREIIPLTDAPDYRLVDFTGRIDFDLPAMCLKKKHRCAQCGQFNWNRQRLYPVVMDRSTWDGSDLCSQVSIPGFKYCTQAVVDVIKKHKLTNFDPVAVKINGQTETND